MFWSIKNVHEQVETGFARARISNVVPVVQEHSLGKHVSQEGRQKWEYFGGYTETSGQSSTLPRYEPEKGVKDNIHGCDRQDHDIFHVAGEI